eukprot:403362947
MLQSKSDQLNQSLLSNPPENNQTQGDVTQRDGASILTKQDDQASSLQSSTNKKTTFDYDGNSEQNIKTCSILTEGRHKKVLFFDKKIIYQQEEKICLRDLTTNAEPIEIINPYNRCRQFKINEQLIAFLYYGDLCIYRYNDIFDPANTYDEENEAWTAKHQTIHLEFTVNEFNQFEVFQNHLIIGANSNEYDDKYTFVLLYKFDYDTVLNRKIDESIEEDIDIDCFIREAISKIDCSEDAPVRLINSETDNLKGFFINRSCGIVHFHDNYIVLRDTKGSDSYIIDFDLMRSEETFNIVHTIHDPITFIRNSNMYLSLDKSKSEYMFYKFQKKIKDDVCTHKLKQISNKYTQNLPADFDIDYSKFVDQNQMIYIFGKFGKNNSKTQNALRSQLIMIDQVNMIVVNKLTFKEDFPKKFKIFVVSNDLKQMFVCHKNGILQIFPYYASSKQEDILSVPQKFITDQLKVSLLTADQNILLFKTSENDCEVMICDTKDYPVKFEKIFNLGFGIVDVQFGSNNEEIIFSPNKKDVYYIAQINYSDKSIYNKKELSSQDKVLTQFHQKFPTCAFIAHESNIEVINYDFLKSIVYYDFGSEKTDRIHCHFLPDNRNKIIALIMMSESYAILVNKYNGGSYIRVQSLNFEDAAKDYQFETKITVYVVNEEKTLLFISFEKNIEVFDLLNMCFIKSLSIKMTEYGQPLYLSFIDSKMQLVLRIIEKSQEGNIETSKAVILTIGMKNDKWKYTSRIILNDFYEYKLNALMGEIKNSGPVQNIYMNSNPPSKVEFEVATDISSNSVTFGSFVKNNKILISLKSVFGEQFNMSNYKLDYFLVDGIQDQRLPTYRIEVNYLNQRYDIFCDIDQQHVTFVQQQFYTDDIEALLSLKSMDDLEIIAMLKSAGDISKYLMHYPQIGNLISIIAYRPRVLEYLIKHFELQDKSNIPMLLFYHQEQSPFDKVTQSNQIKSITYLLELLVKFQNHYCFNHFIDRNLISLIEKQINLSEYFESNLPIIKINHKNFQDLHYDDKELILGLQQISEPKDILDQYDEIFNEHLDQSSQAQQQPIEYNLVNLPDTLTNEPRKLMEVLSQTETMELFETLTIQTIINFKWDTYTKYFFQTQFNIFLIFCLSFMIEILYSLILVDRKSDPITDDRDPIIQYSLKPVSLLVLIYFFVYEIRQAVKQENYMKEIWNFFDYSLIFAYSLLTVLEAAFPYEDFIVILKLVIVFLTFLKINFFLRIYDGFSFLVSMMAAVFVDLKYFIGFFVIFILQFGLVFAILFDAISIEEYQGIGIFAYIMMAFRTSSGDFNVDSYKDQSSVLVVISWVIWIIAVMLLNVMFMNFIIAVISESYEKVMQKLVAESYKVKVQMIVERELHFTEEELTSEQYFPKYLILRRPVSSSEGENGEWQGFVKDIKNTIKTSSTKQKTDIQFQIQALTEKMEVQSQNLKSEVKIGTGALQSQLEAQENKIEMLNNQLVSFIKEQKLQNAAIIQLLKNPKR